jgi:hypothetical protein
MLGNSTIKYATEGYILSKRKYIHNMFENLHNHR